MDVDTLTHESTSVNVTLVEIACCPQLVDVAMDERAAEELAAALKALADPARLRLVSMLVNAPDGEICACDLPGALDRSQPTVSHHLAQLVKAGILTREQRGKWAWFRLDRARLDQLRAALTCC
jgi:ArsR family transcriptional regulator, arsenate/arsenite/antimonite-responsive transcriptional repressor